MSDMWGCEGPSVDEDAVFFHISVDGCTPVLPVVLCYIT